MNWSDFKAFKSSASPEAEMQDFITPVARRRIRVSVIIGHIAMIFVPLLWMMFVNWLRPPKMFHKININMIETPYDLPSTGKSLGAPAPPPQDVAEQAEAPAEEPTPEQPLPDQPLVKDTPKIVEQPKPTPKPTPKPKEPPKPKDPPKEPPKPKDPPKEPVKPVKDTKKFVPISPADILKTNTKVVKGPKGDPNAKLSKRVDPNSVYTGDPNDKIVDNAPVGNLFGGPSNAQLNDYYTSISQYLYRMWQQPGKNLLGGTKPFVTLHMSVDPGGRVVAARITKKSGSVVMDSSVEKLITEVTVLPKPPQGAIEFDVTLKIEDE